MTTAVHVSQDETRLRRRSAGSLYRSLSAGSRPAAAATSACALAMVGSSLRPTLHLAVLCPSNSRSSIAMGGTSWATLPSKEAVLHRAMYAACTGSRAIAHLHSTYSATVSCMDGLDCEACIPPVTAYCVMEIRRLPLLPCFRPGDPRAAEVVGRHACRHCAVLLANHGPIVTGAGLDGAVSAIEELAEAAKLFLLLRGTVRPLDARKVAELRRSSAQPDSRARFPE